MTCIVEQGFIICTSGRAHRLRLADGSRVFMWWHNYLGPEFYRDRAGVRPYYDWYNNPLVVDALNWFIKRGNKS